MKKYVKPELFYEHFELSQHIADCGWEWVNSTNETSCNAKADPNQLGAVTDYLFTSTTGGCVLNENIYEDYCYHNGSFGAQTFKS